MRRLLAAIVLLFCAVSGFAFSPEYLNPRIGVLIINNVLEGSIGAPNALATTFGISLTLPFRNPLFSFEPGLDVYMTYYGWETDNRAHPVEKEYESSALVPGIILEAPVLIGWNFSEKIQGSFGMGGAFVIRAAFRASGSNADDSDIRNIGAWFYQKLRFFHPTVQLGIAYKLQEKFTFQLGARWFVPLFNAWDPEAPSFWDHNMLHVIMGMRIRLD